MLKWFPLGLILPGMPGEELLRPARSCLEWIPVTGLPLKWLIMIWIKPINVTLCPWESG